MNKKIRNFEIGKYTLPIGKRTIIVGILNITPDSFYDGGKYFDLQRAIRRGIEMAKEGADILDIGGESSRPGAQPVSKEKELERIIPAIKGLTEKISIPISIDTYKSDVAEQAIKFGASMVNDISSLRMDKRMVEVIKKYDVPICLMHMKGEPRNMQKRPYYRDVVSEIMGFLEERIEFCLRNGIKKSRIIIDPGIGFGKAVTHNLEILKNIGRFTSLGYPVLLGVSRKSFIGHLLNLESQERLVGSLGAGIWGLVMGADILRVHDVLETKRAAMVVDAIRNAKSTIKLLSKSNIGSQQLDQVKDYIIQDTEHR